MMAHPGRSFCISVLCGFLSLGLSASPRVAPPVTRPAAFFWDRYERGLILKKTAPDSARALARRLVRADPDDLVGQCLRAGSLGTGAADSAEGAALVARAVQAPDSAGLQVAAGLWNFRSGNAEAGRLALERAGSAYLAKGRPADASHAYMLAFHYSRGVGPAPELAADIAKAETLARDIGDAAALADALMLRSAEEFRRDVPKSLDTRRAALSLLEPLGPSFQLSECHRSLGNSLKVTGRSDAALPHYRSALELARALGYREQEIRCLAGLAGVERARGAYEPALALFRQARTRALTCGDPMILADRDGELGGFYFELGHYREARELLGASLTTRRKARMHDSDMVIGLDLLASLEAQTGHYEEARRLWDEALDLCRRYDHRHRLPFVLCHLAQFHCDLGDPTTALATADEGLKTARGVGHERSEPSLHAARSEALEALGRLDEALAAAREATQAARRVEPRQAWSTVRDEALVLRALGRGPEAIAVLDSTLALVRASADSFQLSRLLRIQADLYLDARQADRAMERLDEAWALSRALDNPDQQAWINLAYGRALVQSGRPGPACDRLESGLHWFEERRSLLPASEDRRGYVAHWYDAYATLGLARARAGRADAAFAASEMTHAREMREQIGGQMADLYRRGPRKLVADLVEVESNLSLVQSALLAACGAPASARGVNLRRLESRADSLKARWSGLCRRLQRQSGAVAREIGVMPPVSAADVKRLLRPGERLLAYRVGPDGTLLFEFRPGELQVHEIPLDAEALRTQVSALTRRLKESTDGEWRTSAAALATALLGPCRLEQAPADLIYVVPDGALHLLPFEALPVPTPGHAAPERLLIETSAVSYENSVTLLLRALRSGALRSGARPWPLVSFGDPTRLTTPVVAEPGASPGNPAAFQVGEARSPDRVALLGPLPYARREVEQLLTLIPGSGVFVGAEATEGRFLAEIGRSRMLHVAAHAIVDDRHPNFSGIVLAPDPPAPGRGAGTDGLVQAFEIMTGRCDLDLAVLSACETGQGAFQCGEGLIGLTRAFRLAGARRIIASLWKIDDASTAELMHAFYERLARGETAVRALRGAKLEFLGTAGGPDDRDGEGSASRGIEKRLRSRPHAAPGSWAPFVLIGARETTGLLEPAAGRRRAPPAQGR